MHVCLDGTSLLGAARFERGRTGLTRYAIELMRAMKELMPDLKLRCQIFERCAFDSEIAVPKIKKLWPDLSENIYPQFRSRFRLGRLYRMIDSAVFHPMDGPSPVRLLRKFLLAPMRFITQMDGRRVLPRPALFHSLHLWPPPQRTLRETPYVLTIHDVLPLTRPEFFPPRLFREFRRRLGLVNPRTDHIICDSDATRREFLSLLSKPVKHCSVVSLAASKKFLPINNSCELGKILVKWGLKADHYIFSAATLEPRKNLPLLLKCYDELVRNREVQNWPLVVAGAAGPAAKEIRHLAGASQGKVILTGYVSDDELCALYNGAGVFVYIPHCEGFGLPPLEAMQCGAPVIVSSCSSLPAVAGDAGLKVSPSSGTELCKALKKVIHDAALRSELRHRGLERAKRFSWTQTAQMTLDIYRAAMR